MSYSPYISLTGLNDECTEKDKENFLLLVYCTPSIPDICQHKGHEKAYPRHHRKRELTAACIGNGERRLEVGSRRIERRVVIAHAEQQGKDGEHRAHASIPYSTAAATTPHSHAQNGNDYLGER